MTASESVGRSDAGIPQGEDRGSKVEIVGGPPPADALEGAEPRGDQTQPAEKPKLERAPEKKLSVETIQRLGRAELQAIAQKRGYEIPEFGTRSTRIAFIKAQDEDDSLASTPNGGPSTSPVEADDDED